MNVRADGLKVAAGVTLVAAAVVGMVIAGGSGANAIASVSHLLATVQAAGPLGWLVFAATQALVAMLGLVPASLLGIGAGLAYGVSLGFALSALGTLVGGWIAFQLSRSLLRPWIAGLLASRVRAMRLDEAIARDGWRLVCLLRVSPIMPFAVTSYVLGLTRVEPRAYLLGTLASLPALLGYVVLGALTKGSLSAALGSAGPLRWGLLLLGLVATALVILRIGQVLAAAGFTPRNTPRVRSNSCR